MAAGASLWPWLAVAAAGALHGLNPVSGWAVLAWQERGVDRMRLARALLPVAVGNLASIVVVAAAVPVALGLRREFDPRCAQALAAVLLALVVVRHLRGCAQRSPSAGIGLWSFIVGIAHGTGWLLVPAFVPLCLTDLPGARITASGSVLLAAAAAAIHVAGMLAAMAAMTVLARGCLAYLVPKNALPAVRPAFTPPTISSRRPPVST